VVKWPIRPARPGTALRGGPVRAGLTVGAGIALARADAAPADAPALAFGRILPRQVVTDLMPVLADDRPDLVIWEVRNPGAAMAARLAGNGADQFSNAGAVARAGAGRMIPPGELSAGRIAGAARVLLDDAGIRDRARGLAKEVAAMPSPAQVARGLACLVA
jgi:hypothetical protein